MAGEPSAAHKRAVELMADGHWHRRDDLVLEMGKIIPTGTALRDTEQRRVRRQEYRRSLGKPVMERETRIIQRSVEYRAAAGRRRLCVAVLSNRRFDKLIDANGVIWHRDRHLPLPAEPISSSTPHPSVSAEPAEVDET